jgi:hypothetical protein
MTVRNLTAWTDEEYLADSIRCWQEALERKDYVAFEYWARHSLNFAANVRSKTIV